MRAWWCGFALGVIWLQQQAELPGWRGGCLLVSLACAASAVAIWGLRRRAEIQSDGHSAVAHWTLRRWRSFAGWCAVCCVAWGAGFGYAAWRADVRLAASLPPAWEGRDIDVTGSIKGLPARDDNGARFLFDVESVDSHEAGPLPPTPVIFPRVIQLAWIADEAPPPLQPGARWRLRVRLKRPHGNANFGLRDAEAALLARNVRATGYVSAAAQAVRLRPDARGVGVTVDRWRAALRARIDAVLGSAPHRGIVVALAIGAQDEISDADWQLMRATGTSHLVAISGLHIGFAAGIAAWLAGAFWRRSGWIGRNWPLWLPAQIVAVTGGALFAALHAALAGFNVPVQRALWMASVVALAYVSGRNVPRSAVLAWALGLVVLIDPWAVVSAGFWLSFCAVAAILFATSGRPRVWDREQHFDEIDDDGVAAGGVLAASSRASGLWRSLRFPRFRTAAARRIRAFGERLHGAAHVQFAVTLALAPLTVYWFAQIPLIGPLANAFAIPWVSVLVTPSVLAGVVLPAPLDAYAWRIAHALLDVMIAGLQRLSGPRWVLWWLPQPNAWTLAAAAAGVLWCLAPRGWPLRWAAPLTWLPLVVPAPSGPPHGSFRLTALDVGQGTSVLVETAHHALLFDAGPGPESTHAGERVVVPYLRAHGVNALDTLIISHADSDHSGGAPAVLDAIEVRQMVAALAPANALWTNARQRGADTWPCAAGQRWQWDGVEFAMLWPDPGPLQGKPNAHCCVLRVSTLPLAVASELGGAVRSAAESAGVDGTGDTDSSVRSAPTSASNTAPTGASTNAPTGASTNASNSAPTAGPTPQPQATPLAALLTADIEAPSERVLLSRDREMLRAEVLVVPHHGSKTSSTEPFLDSIDPLIALFQVGYRNRFHHPSAGVLARYSARHIELGRSDSDGAVRVLVDPYFAAREAPHAPDAALTVERYRDTQRRYWMDR
ncbi:competence protein ComEC [Paraburkholderia graminis]|uniref:ComEC/Rec2 family competence protein n=1 Tax=Paraburkholderia TaxID=1822464 RepID=UPI000DEF46F6|nr:ComEC/Rec2 family competence protein [Paraburkholderia graminis]AXF08485.1 competence protein ComEC [Paraburkholderia graminis]